MGNHWAIPLVFGILFFSTVFSAQDVYGPHYTNFDGVRHHYQGQNQYIMVVDYSLQSHGPRCLDVQTRHQQWGTSSATVQIEVGVSVGGNPSTILLGPVTQEPIQIIGDHPTLKKFCQAEPFVIPFNPVGLTDASTVQVTASIQIINPGEQNMGPPTIQTFTVPLDFGPSCATIVLADGPPQCSGTLIGETCQITCNPGFAPNPAILTCEAVDDDVADWDTIASCVPIACIPPNCEGQNNCSGNGVCVADDQCVCQTGYEQNPDCSVPECDVNNPCVDDDNHCTQTVCHENQCVSFSLPGCVPNDRCEINDECSAPDECHVSFCNSVGSCQNEPIPGCEVCEETGDELCDGIDNDCNGAVDDGFDDLGTACSVGVGACERIGVFVCDSSGAGSMCSVFPGAPSDENNAATCADGIDNDCDGLVDCNDPACLDPDLGVTCSLPCNPTGDEVCDGLDNNCDGQIDEGIICTPSQCGEDTQCMFWSVNENGQCQQNFVALDSPCDDGQFCTSGDVCDGQGNCLAGGPTCTDGTCDESQNVCIPDGFCGDGVRDPSLGEECDSGGLNTTTCDADCTLPVCGDGLANSSFGEACDDGDANNNNDCTNVCQVAFCGDGITHNQGTGTEQCDDGNRTDGDGCSANCTIETSDIVFFTEQELFRLINDYRSQRGVDTLLYDPDIASISRLHSEDMASTGQLNPNWSDGTTFSERLIIEGVCSSPSGTTVAFNSAGFDAELVFQLWRDNPSHNAILLHTTNLAGIGVDPSGNYYTASFCFE